MAYASTFSELLSSYRIRNIQEDTRFWMIRTKKGFFYDEFINEHFVALGWNVITSLTDMGEQSIGNLKQIISREYGESRPMGAINKCKSFIFDIQEGDYIVIPSSGSTKIAFAKAGAYYEDSDCNVDDEKEIIAKIDNSEYEISKVKCPYKKRRHIEILNIVNSNDLGYGLRRAISSYHGISNFDEYATDILNGIYDCYAYLNDVHFSINITKNGELKPREISRLLYALTEFFCGLVDEDSLSTTINLNSPGSVRIKLKEGFEKLKEQKVVFVCIFLAITGGSGFGFELPGISGVIREFRTMDIQIEQEQVELEKKREELEAQKLANTQSLLEIMRNAEDQGIDVEELMRQLGILQELDTSLQFETKEQNETKALENINEGE